MYNFRDSQEKQLNFIIIISAHKIKLEKI